MLNYNLKFAKERVFRIL